MTAALLCLLYAALPGDCWQAVAQGEYERPPLGEMPVSLTSYWIFDEQGDYLPGWGGQCDSSCEDAANGVILTLDMAGRVGACISSWVKFRPHTLTVVFSDGSMMECVDAFGRESYRQPFFHEGYGRWVIPADILYPPPGVHGLVENWRLIWSP